MILKCIVPTEQTERHFHKGMRAAMGLLNLILPETEEVVKAKNQEDEKLHVQLPDELQDPLAVLDRDQVKVH